MSEEPKILEYNLGSSKTIARELSDDEKQVIENYKIRAEAAKLAAEQKQIEIENKKNLKIAALAKLGLTEEEVNAFLN